MQNAKSSGLSKLDINILGSGLFGFLFLSSNPTLAFLIFIAISIYFGFGALAAYVSDKSPVAPTQNFIASQKGGGIQPSSSAAITDERTIADRINEALEKGDYKCPHCGATVSPLAVKCIYCGSVLAAAVGLPGPEKWDDVEIGQTVLVKHPQKGDLRLTVVNRTFYGELWQKQMRPDVPWTLTGSYFARLGFAGGASAVNWQSRFFFLDGEYALSDQDINRDFAPYARQFAASNQTKTVRFSYKDAYWAISDIGRFRIEFVEGEGIKAQPGAIGRFIHFNSDARAMILEDYQSGGNGLDRIMYGYQIEEKQIKF
ncbi:MAG: zinc ribbon domain-containing protein [Anaerolineales bacterium]|nr:zinc ribbon domain-containing protein [Anaerolineales bacterium]